MYIIHIHSIYVCVPSCTLYTYCTHVLVEYVVRTTTKLSNYERSRQIQIMAWKQIGKQSICLKMIQCPNSAAC